MADAKPLRRPAAASDWLTTTLWEESIEDESHSIRGPVSWAAESEEKYLHIDILYIYIYTYIYISLSIYICIYLFCIQIGR